MYYVKTITYQKGEGMEEDLDRAKKILKKYNQEHIIDLIQKLTGEAQAEVIKQVLSIDFEELEELYELAKKEIEIDTSKIEPIEALNPERLNTDVLTNYIETGKKIIEENKLAVVILAGGQGSRLGNSKPKGTLKVNVLPKPKCLFQIAIENLIRERIKYNVNIPLYIMTSKENNKETIEFLETNEYFGYPKKDINIFIQEEIPLLDENGKLLIDEDMKIREAANGNGGIFNSMLREGIIEDLDKRGILWVSVGSIDNILLKSIDPLLIGLCAVNDTYIGAKTVLRNSPKERVGVFCKKNNKVKIIEYTELPEKMTIEINKNMELVFGEAHILSNLFHIKAVKRTSTKELEYHTLSRRASYINKNWELVRPTKPNCYKFEKFIFDTFGLFNDISLLRCKREENFAPIKNRRRNR